MKRIIKLITLFTICIFLSGCTQTETMTCIKEVNEEDTIKTKSTYIIVYDEEDKIVKVTKMDITLMDENMIDYNINSEKEVLKKYEGLKGIKVSLKKLNNNSVEKVLTIDYRKIDDKELENNDLSHNALYSKKLNLEKFNNYFLDGYTCNSKRD